MRALSFVNKQINKWNKKVMFYGWFPFWGSILFSDVLHLYSGSCFTVPFFFLEKNIYVFIWKSYKEQGRDREIFHISPLPPSILNDSWIGLKPGALNSLWNSHMSGRIHILRPFSAVFQGTLIGSWIGNGAFWIWTSTLMWFSCLKEPPNLLCHNADPIHEPLIHKRFST